MGVRSATAGEMAHMALFAVDDEVSTAGAIAVVKWALDDVGVDADVGTDDDVGADGERFQSLRKPLIRLRSAIAKAGAGLRQLIAGEGLEQRPDGAAQRRPKRRRQQSLEQGSVAAETEAGRDRSRGGSHRWSREPCRGAAGAGSRAVGLRRLTGTGARAGRRCSLGPQQERRPSLE